MGHILDTSIKVLHGVRVGIKANLKVKTLLTKP